MLDDWFDTLCLVVSVACAVFGLVLIAGLLVLLPITGFAEAECLRMGYNKASVSIFLERYCVRMEGAVTTAVVPLK